MACEHRKIKSVNCELYCIECGEKLPPYFFTRKLEEPKSEPKKQTRKKG